MTAYKRNMIPLKGGRCLAERLRDGSLRITLGVKNMAAKPLELWLFDSDKMFRCPKTLFADRTGTLVFKNVFRDTGLEDVRCICLMDENRQAELTGYASEKTDWQAIMLKGAAEETPEPQEINEENFKEQVKELVAELDDRLCGDTDDLRWKKISLEELAKSSLCSYARNPFVAEECQKYGYLMLAENEKFRYLAVPCEQKDRMRGRTQGFRRYKNCCGTDCCILKAEK